MTSNVPITIASCFYSEGDSACTKTLAAVQMNNSAVAQLVSDGDWEAAEAQWSSILSLLESSLSPSLCLTHHSTTAAYIHAATTTAAWPPPFAPLSLLDKGLDILSSTHCLVDLHCGFIESSVGASTDIHDAHDLCSSLVFTISCFNLAQTRLQRNDTNGAAFFYQQALEGMLHVTNTIEMVVDGVQAKTQHLIRSIAIPALYTLGRLAVWEKQWTTATSYMNVALTHAMNLTVVEARSSFRNATLATCPTTGSALLMIQHSGAILNALGVIHSQMSTMSSLLSTAQECATSARFFLTEALPVIAEGWGTDSSVMATTLHNLGKLLVHHHSESTSATALAYLERALEIRKTALDPTCLDIAASLLYLGHALYQTGDINNAMERFGECITHSSMLKTDYESDVVSMLLDIAVIFRQQEDIKMAAQLYKRCLVSVKSEFGERHITMADILHKLALLYFQHQMYENALPVVLENLQVVRTAFESSHPNVIATLFLVGETYRKLNRLKLALKFCTEAMELQRVHHGELSIPMAVALHNIGLLHEDMGDMQRALECLQASLRIREVLQGSDHLDLIDVTVDTAELLFRNEMVTTGLEALTDAWRICTLHSGCNDIRLACILLRIGECQLRLGNATSAAAFLMESLRIQRRNDGCADRWHTQVKFSTLKELGDARKLQGDFDGAIDCYQQALFGQHTGSIEEIDPDVLSPLLSDLCELYLAQGQVEKLVNTLADASRLLQEQDTMNHILLDFRIVIMSHLFTARWRAAPAA